MSRLMLTGVSLLALLSACKADIDESGKGDVDGQDEGDEEEERIPLSFDMVDPAGAAYTEDGIVAVNGVVGGDSPVVTVNGTPAAIEDGLWDGSASHLDVLWPDSPLFPILGEATDAHGGWARDRVVLAKGATTDTSAEIPSAIGARLTDHALVALDPVIQETIAGLDLGELLVSSDPVADILGADVYVTAASLGGATVDLDFTERGLAYTLVASDIDATLLLDFGWFDTDGDVYVERVDISGLVFMEIQDGEHDRHRWRRLRRSRGSRSSGSTTRPVSWTASSTPFSPKRSPNCWRSRSWNSRMIFSMSSVRSPTSSSPESSSTHASANSPMTWMA